MAEALVTVLHRGEIGQIYNIGTDFEISNLDLAKDIIEKFNLNTEEFVEFVADRAFNDKRYAIDSSKMESIGWTPQVSWEEGIRKTSKILAYMPAEIQSFSIFTTVNSRKSSMV